jgi:hypothetical protein
MTNVDWAILILCGVQAITLYIAYQAYRKAELAG